METVGDILVPNGRYKAVLRIPERGGLPARSLMLVITCGSRIACAAARRRTSRGVAVLESDGVYCTE